ncbi:MAG: deoxyribonuclease IV [Planctomycetota bacterium]
MGVQTDIRRLRERTGRRVGFHVSIAGGLDRSVDRAVERECTAFQIFCGNPRAWKLDARPRESVRAFRTSRADADLRPLIVHACYLINPCSADGAVIEKSVRRLADELTLSGALGAEYYVLHPGSHKGRPAEWGLQRAAESIRAALEAAEDPPVLLLESMASPHGPGGDFERLGRLIGALDEEGEAETGVAIDSCHVFGAGYDLREAAEVDRLVADVEEHVGLQRLHLAHVNDARDEAGSRRDRHTHIGRGQIGESGFRNLLNHPALADLPLILETPWESVEVDLRNLRAVLRLFEGTPG